MVPANLFAAMANGENLPLIVFSLFAGIGLSTMGDMGKPLVTLMESLFELSMKMVRVVVIMAPIGVFALVATRVGKAGGIDRFSSEIAAVGYYVATVIAGLLIHAVVPLGFQDCFRLVILALLSNQEKKNGIKTALLQLKKVP